MNSEIEISKPTNPELLQFLWILILTCDLFFNYLPPVVYLLTLAMMLLLSSRIEVAFILIFFPGIMFVDVFDQFIIGNKALLILLCAGLMLLSAEIMDLKTELSRAVLPLLLILFAFVLTYTYAPKGYYSGYKTVSTIINGLAYFFFFAIFIRSANFRNIRIALLMLFLFVFFVKFEYLKGVLSIPDGFFDFGFIRRESDMSLDTGLRFTGYHQFGALALFAVIFLISVTEKLGLFHLLFILAAMYFGFLSGARQMIFGILVILAIYIVKYFKSNQLVLIPLFIFVIAMGTVAFRQVKIPFVSDFLFNTEVFKDDGRRALYEKAIDLFEENPLMGTGMGGFDPLGAERDYPHNIVLEMMAEGGMFMLLVVFLTLYFVLKRSEFKPWAKTSNGTVFLFIVLALAVRAFSSSDLIENIGLLSGICAIGIWELKTGDAIALTNTSIGS